MTPTKKPFENIVGKGENIGNQHFLLFPQCFQPFTKQFSNFHLCLSSAHASNLDQSKNMSFGKDLITSFKNIYFHILTYQSCNIFLLPKSKLLNFVFQILTNSTDCYILSLQNTKYSAFTDFHLPIITWQKV